MKHQTIMTTFCALVLALLGCETKETPVTAGPFDVNSDTGLATGQVFGIDFRVTEASEAEVTSELSGNSQYSSRAEITLADDLNIELETMNEGSSVILQLNGRKFGNLERGDEVVIDEGRNVTVNGEKRLPQESPPE